MNQTVMETRKSFVEDPFDSQCVINMSLEKLQSERRRRSGANLHRSLMICDMLVKLRSHVLASEDAEVRPTLAPVATSCEDEDESESEPSSKCEVADDSHEQAVEAPRVSHSEPVQMDMTDRQSHCDAVDAQNGAKWNAERQPQSEECEFVKVELPRVDQRTTKVLCERRKRSYSSIAEAEPFDDKRCRLVPESPEVSDYSESQDALQVSALSGYVAVPVTLLNGGLHYMLGVNGNVLLAYSTQLCASASAKLQLPSEFGAPTTGENVPLVIVIS